VLFNDLGKIIGTVKFNGVPRITIIHDQNMLLEFLFLKGDDDKKEGRHEKKTLPDIDNYNDCRFCMTAFGKDAAMLSLLTSEQFRSGIKAILKAPSWSLWFRSVKELAPLSKTSHRGSICTAGLDVDRNCQRVPWETGYKDIIVLDRLKMRPRPWSANY